MGIFKKTEKETIYDDYDDESYRDEELLEEADKEKAANKMFNILNIYETFDKKNKKKHEDRKSGELDALDHDIAIVYTEKGNYIYIFFAWDAKDNNHARKILSETSKLVFDDFMSK